MKNTRNFRRNLAWRQPGLLVACLALHLSGCERLAHSFYLSGYDRDIENAARTIDAARDDSARARAYSKRGSAYAEKARYSRFSKLIADDEYQRLFALAIEDHRQAVALDPSSPDVYLNRGQAFYDRAVLDSQDRHDPKPWFDRAAADFETAIRKDPRNDRAFDRLGLVHQATGEPEKAIEDFTREMALNPLGKARLNDAYCTLGSLDQGRRQFAAAARDYRKSIELGGGADGCACDPYDPLVAVYTVETRQYDEAWEIVHLAQQSKHWISPELIDRLTKDSGRTQ